MLDPHIAWQAIVAISALLGIIISLNQLIGKPMQDLSSNMANLGKELTGLSILLNEIKDQVHCNDKDNSDSHKRIWEHMDETDTKVAEHDKAIAILKERK